MPVLTKEQVLEAAFELLPEEREDLRERLAQDEGLQLTEEQKEIIRAEIEAHRRDPSTAISREELMTKMRAML